jgi:hypothetical protein
MSTRRKHHELEQGAMAAAAGGLAAAGLTWWRFTSHLKHLIHTYEKSGAPTDESHAKFMLDLKHLAYTDPHPVYPSLTEAGPERGLFAGPATEEEEDLGAVDAPRAESATRGGDRVQGFLRSADRGAGGGWGGGMRARSDSRGRVETGGPFGAVKVGQA